uniref:Uncharacterized protein n=1 Tax=Anguilla anguilla TaxID=7936 RepID=A0A0E9Q5L2_ANGAN
MFLYWFIYVLYKSICVFTRCDAFYVCYKPIVFLYYVKSPLLHCCIVVCTFI